MTKPQRYGVSSMPCESGLYVLHKDYLALEAEVQGLREDAGRYQWLRQQPNDTTAPRIDVVQWQELDESANEGHGLRLEELDATIDAARAKDQS
ncbi:hypothetical protein [Paraburkholderia gardini]|uniref:hypothetical protein n=1 Tax=Paraburkholderia gardini TaxID=2823469 RepID=UPI001DDF93A3|nr:hypothetical protein [Paraburkholderia gardini]CAG4889407.1 hypothetical protein R69919_00735 [Paraburkholderia gardini]